MYSTLIGTAELAGILDDPALVVVDVRHDLAQPVDWGEAPYAAGHLPGGHLGGPLHRPAPKPAAPAAAPKPGGRAIGGDL